MRIAHQVAYVLHRRPYRESSLLLDVFSRKHGRVTLLAKGIRQLKSRYRCAMIPFSLLSMSWSGKGELPVLTQSENEGPVTFLQGRQRLCGFYVNELLVKLLHRYDPHLQLFDAYHDLLGILNSGLDTESNLRLFEKRMLQELGYALELEHESDGVTKVNPDACYQYVPTFGAVRIEREAKNEQTLTGSTLLALSKERLADKQCRDESKQLMRTVINHHLGQYKLHARNLFKAY